MVMIRVVVVVMVMPTLWVIKGIRLICPMQAELYHSSPWLW
jgi:hypothetical protein